MNERKRVLLLGNKLAEELRELEERGAPRTTPAKQSVPVPETVEALARPDGVTNEQYNRALEIVSREGITEVSEIAAELWTTALGKADVELWLERHKPAQEVDPSEPRVVTYKQSPASQAREDRQLDQALANARARRRDLVERAAEEKVASRPEREWTIEVTGSPTDPEVTAALAEIERAETNQALQGEQKSDV